MVGMPGFEPGLQTPEACIMPLYYIPMCCFCVKRLAGMFHVKHFGELFLSGHSGHGSGQTVDILDKLGIILDTVLDKLWT